MFAKKIFFLTENCIRFRYRSRAIIGRSRFEAALVYKPRILGLKNEEIPFLKTGYQKNRQLLRMANLQQFLAVSCQLHKYISQNLGSDGHLEGLNMLKSQLNQNL